ncbi:unnamed protein product [Prunus armeniaca]|uniref:Wall-associated receptor kinase galacturonan-binding domain-containing protein n=1 Tax=Prunus armeniaca TaxID=36596 RepID=A0A6J5UZ54_PRUAR|nr:unnamed protein product [Prunus armeniaca]CAB4311118.1 unnamed protein product [Prunus armeniaca]
MDDFPAKLVVIAALVLLLMGDFQATCAISLPHEGRGRSSLWHVDCRDGLAKIHIGRKQGSFGCQGENFSKKIMPIRRSLRPITGLKPPSPTLNRSRRQFVPAPPIIQ